MRASIPKRLFLFLGLLTLASPLRVAALDNASLQGSYSFTFQRVDASVINFFFTTAVGTLAFDGSGNVTANGFANRNGSTSALSSLGTYTLDAAGTVEIILPNLTSKVIGKVSFDLNSLVSSNIGAGTLQSHEVLLAARTPPQALSLDLLNGKYFLAERTITTTSGSPQFENASGTITFDGEGGFTREVTSNHDGSATPLQDSGTYRIEAATVLLSLPDRNDPVIFGFTPDGGIGFGATLRLSSNQIHDLFALAKAGESGAGENGLLGSFHLVAGTFRNSVPVENPELTAGFSTAAGTVHFRGDGQGLYQLEENLTGITAVVAGESPATFDGQGGLQLNRLAERPGLYLGGTGNSGHALVAASLSDPTVFDFLTAIRTPSLPTAVTNAASFLGETAISPGALFTIFGQNLAWRTAFASALPLPRQLGGAAVSIGGIDAPLLFVSPFQINAQVPFELPPGPVQITIVLDGVESGPLDATVNPTGPGLFTVSQDGTGTGIFQHGSDFSTVNDANPARPGEVLVIYATGLGTVLPEVASGAAAPDDLLSHVTASRSVQIDGKDSRVRFAGLAPRFVGLYQLNVEVPADIATAGSVPVVVTVAGVDSSPVTLPVSP